MSLNLSIYTSKYRVNYSHTTVDSGEASVIYSDATDEEAEFARRSDVLMEHLTRLSHCDFGPDPFDYERHPVVKALLHETRAAYGGSYSSSYEATIELAMKLEDDFAISQNVTQNMEGKRKKGKKKRR